MNSYQTSLISIKRSATILLELSERDEIYQSLVNDLLVKVYSSYETFLKRILMEIYSDAKGKFNYIPILSDHKMNDQVNKYFTPSSRTADIVKYFPLMKKSYYYENLKTVDTIVDERNSYAHTGSHKADDKKIFRGLVEIQFVVRFLYYYYNSKNLTEITTINNYLDKECFFLKSLYDAEKIVNQYDGNVEKITPTARPQFDTLSRAYKEFITQESVDLSQDKRCISRCINGNSELDFFEIEDSVEIVSKKIKKMIEIMEVNSFGYYQNEKHRLSTDFLEIIDVIYNNIQEELVF